MSDLATAVERADQARAAIADIIDSVRSGERDLPAAFVLADNEPLAGRCFAVKVFEAVPGIGKVRARRTMDEVGLAEDIWIVNVAEPQRDQMMAAFAADD